jgi:hypothetical protein
MRTIRFLTPFVACAALVLVASSAGAVTYYSILGKLSENRGKNTNVPQAGNTGCGSLTVFEGPFPGPGGVMLTRGVNTQPQAALTPGFMFMTAGKDIGCVKHGGVTWMGAERGAIQTTGGAGVGVGKAFTLPPRQFRLPYPKYREPAHYMFKTDIPVQEIKFFAPAVQLATSVNITAPPPVRAHHSPTQGGSAPFRKFKAGAYASQSGRLGPVFAWCPPPLTMVNTITNAPGDTACTATHADFKAKVDYKGAGAGFGGTMSLVTHQVAGVGSLALGFGPVLAFNNFGGGESLPTGAGYANRHHISLPSGSIFGMFAKSKRYIGPKLGSQSVVKSVMTPMAVFAGMTMWPGGDVYDWGFPFTTMTVVVKKPVAGMTTTITAKGWDCVGGMEGPGCGRTTAVPGAARNISLVAGGIGIARLGPPFGDSPTVNIGSSQMIVLPEPGKALQLLAGAVGLLGIAVWRSRRNR